MGKSNKFDYTNRPNSGAKLGHIIGGAIQKEADKVKKDAERHLQKARKRSTDSSSAALDLPLTTHLIDLKAPGKALGDDGVCALLDGLKIGLKSGTRQASLVLVELDLSGNCITTASLSRLAVVIELARHNLKTLNLAHNNIKVESDEQAFEWERFLQGFRHCRKLRGFDLSDNEELGCRALEILARVHAEEQHIRESPHSTEVSTLSLQFDSDESLDEQDAEVDSSSDDRPPMSTRGLRSVPFINLCNTGMDDAGALWLSYVLEDHPYPVQLIPGSDATHSEPISKVAQPEMKLHGIEWHQNETLGKEGAHLLERSETLRRQIMLDGCSPSMDSDAAEIDSVIGNQKDTRKSVEMKHLRPHQEYRRASLRSNHTADSGEHEVSELESARKKIKRAIIAHDGPSSVELWHAALGFVRASRLIMYLAPRNRVLYVGPPLFKCADAIISPSFPGQRVEDAPIADHLKGLSIDPSPTNPPGHVRNVSYASKLASPKQDGGQTKAALTEVTNILANPTILHKTSHRKGAFGEGNGLQTLHDKLNRVQVRNEDPLRFVKYQEERIAEVARRGRQFRDSKAACNLPVNIMERVIGFIMPDGDFNVMNEDQRRAAISWGQRRGTLLMEREWLRKDESAQVLMLLDSIDCLAYGR